jgi:hypothetical protein
MVLRAVLDGRRDAWTFRATYLSDGAPAGACSEPPHGAPREITDSENSEAGHAVGIAAPQTSRLRTETKHPLESVSLHPQRGLTFRARQEVERGPDANHDRCLNAPEVVRHPELLL